MHELAIAQSIVDLVEACAAEHDAAQVKNVRLQIGEASGIIPDSLTFSFEVLVSLQPLLSGASLLIEIVPHRARCRRCAQEFHVENFVAQCPTCQTWESEIISGTELQVLEIEIACQHSKEQQPCPK